MSTHRLYNYLTYPQYDLSGGIQRATSHLLRKRNEVYNSKNAAYNIKIGSAVRRPGYEKVGNTVQQGNDSLGGGVYRYGANNKILCGVNNAAGTLATLQYFDTGNYWTTVISSAIANTRFQAINDLDQYFVAGKVPNTTSYLPLTNIDYTLTASTTRNVYKAPASAFIAEYNGNLYAINCQVNSKTYADRAYQSSPPLGFITLVQTDQTGLLQQLSVDSTRWLKVGMSVDIYTGSTEAKQVSALTIISIDKKNKRITFAATQLTVQDNDEIWLTGTKGTLSRYWNTDDPTPETADWFKVPPGKEANPEFTGWGKNSNRLFLFTKNTFLKWDGTNLITVSDTVGCVSHETIQNIGSWTIWLHTTGIWGYNESTGQLKLLSRAIQPYIQAINQNNLRFASAGVVGRVYKLAVGELLPLESGTTSTSTSSTSTSSTSSSTSSTSTSSTSTSSTSSSTSQTTTSTSSTSISTSSTSSSTSTTSTSSTSTSVSTSTSSTSTTTLASTKNVTRLVYDFDMNAWWPETHKREIRFQFNHSMNGYTKPYFTDETGRLFRDEVGNKDNDDIIPFEVELGRNNFGTDVRKTYSAVLVDSDAAREASLQYSLDGGQYQTLAQIDKPVNKFPFSTSALPNVEARDISYKIVHSDAGDAPIINGLSTTYQVQERIVDEGE